MTRAVTLAEIADGAVLTVDSTNSRIGIGTTNPQALLQVGTGVSVYGNSGIVSATTYYGSGANLTGITGGATLSAGSGDQRVVVTSLTSGTMTSAATDAELTYNSGTNTLSATTFSGALTGNATGLTGTPDITVRNITGVAATFTGVLTYEDVTNIDSIGIITARSGVSIGDSIFHTGDTNTAIRFPAADTFTVETAGSERLRVDSGGKVGVNQSTPQTTFHSTGTTNGQQATFGIDDSGLKISTFQKTDNDAGVILDAQKSSNGTLTFATAGTERLRITSAGGIHFANAELIERVSIVANKLSAVPNVSLDNGMVHYYTTNETATANPNIITTAGINTNMATGDTMSVTILSKPNNAGYFPRISIDGRLAGITTYWNGGSAPSSAESSGVNINTYQIIKTANETFDVLANTSNFA